MLSEVGADGLGRFSVDDVLQFRFTRPFNGICTAKMREQFQTRCRPHAGYFVQNRLQGFLASAVSVMRKGKAVRFISEVLNQLECG